MVIMPKIKEESWLIAYAIIIFYPYLRPQPNPLLKGEGASWLVFTRSQT